MVVVLNWRAIWRGSANGFALIIPLAIVQAFIGDHSNALVTIAFLFALTFAGYVAGRFGPELPYAHGALAGLGALVAWVTISLVRDAVTSNSPHYVRILASALLAIAFGILGALFAARMHRMGVS